MDWGYVADIIIISLPVCLLYAMSMTDDTINSSIKKMDKISSEQLRCQGRESYSSSDELSQDDSSDGEFELNY